MRNSKFQIFTGKNKQYYFRLKAENGQIILSSEGYTAKSGCQNSITSVKTNATQDEQYQRETAKDGQFYFVLKAANGQPLGHSEMYTRKENRDRGIEAVKRTAPTAAVEDAT